MPPSVASSPSSRGGRASFGRRSLVRAAVPFAFVLVAGVATSGAAQPEAAEPEAPEPGAAETATAQPSPASIDPLTVAPFRWHELLRLDVRPGSPLTEGTLLTQPVAPIDVGDPSLRLAVLAAYRLDRLTGGLGVGARHLHRFELGVPVSKRLAPDWAIDLDLRAVYAGSLDGHHGEAWFPNLRVGATWSATPELATSISVVFTRGALGLLPLPAFGLAWRPTPRFRVEGLLPRFLEVAGRPADRVEVFVAGHWEALVWSTAIPTNHGRELLTRQEIRAHAGARFSVFGPLGIEVATHWTPFQQLAGGGLSTRPASLEDLSLTAALVLDRAFRRSSR